MKKYYFLIIVALILGLVLTGCTLLSNISQVPTTEQSGISYLTKGTLVPGNLVGLWHFDEGVGVGTVVDSSGYWNNGNVTGAATGVAGKFGNALSFDGVDDYVSIPDSTSLDISSMITVEAWVKADTLGNQNAIIRKGLWNTAVIKSWGLDIQQISGVKKARFFIYDGTTGYLATSGAITTDTWHHLAGTYNGTTVDIYLDGSNLLSTSDTHIGGIDITTEDIVIGMRNDDCFFDGLIDEVRIWDIALDSTQITHSYELGVNDEMEYVTQLNQQDLLDGGVAIFTSAFYVGRLNLGVRVDVSARAMIVGPDAVVDDHDLRGITPKGAEIDWNVTAQPPTGFDITAYRKNKKAKSLHLSMLLNTGEGLGVNVQFLPYD